MELEMKWSPLYHGHLHTRGEKRDEPRTPVGMVKKGSIFGGLSEAKEIKQRGGEKDCIKGKRKKPNCS